MRRLPQHQEDMNAASTRQRFKVIYTHYSQLSSRSYLDVKLLELKMIVNTQKQDFIHPCSGRFNKVNLRSDGD
jgi:hypothetical protein